MSQPGPVKRWALSGRIVTMTAKNAVTNGTMFIEGERIKAITAAGAPAPAGFETVTPVAPNGTIYPGLIELHNHLSYNILPLWQVPKTYQNRDQWGGAPVYRTEVSGPMAAIAQGDDGKLLPALVRYVESKCLIGGTTTSQGITLQAWSSQIRRYYKGVLRTAEIGRPPELPAAHSHIADVDARDWTKFDKALDTNTCMLLHLSEGKDEHAHNAFLALKNSAGEWAIEASLAGIHCAALAPADFQVMAQHKGSMVWSPLSNLLLYGETANIKAARAAGVVIALGPDWSPSGSKNLLGELKAAKVATDQFNLGFDDFELVSLATRNPAKMLKWDKSLGTLEAGKFADFLVVAGTTGDPYQQLLSAREDAIALVAIAGRPRYGQKLLMQNLGATGETVTIGGSARIIDFDTPDDDPDIENITLAAATTRLKAALSSLGTLQTHGQMLMAAMAMGQPVQRPTWRLALDEQFQNQVELRPRLALDGAPTGPDILTAAAAAPPVLHPIKLDPLTVVDDPDFLPKLRQEQNLPPGFADALVDRYSA